MRIAVILVALLCAAIVGRLVLHVPLTALLIAVGTLAVVIMLGQLWLSEKAYRHSEHARNKDLAGEREHARARLRERGD